MQEATGRPTTENRQYTILIDKLRTFSDVQRAINCHGDCQVWIYLILMNNVIKSIQVYWAIKEMRDTGRKRRVIIIVPNLNKKKKCVKRITKKLSIARIVMPNDVII